MQGADYYVTEAKSAEDKTQDLISNVGLQQFTKNDEMSSKCSSEMLSDY